MKAISIRQPWAWLIVHGIKDIENRSWRTSHRGAILIHAPLTLNPNLVSICQDTEDELGIYIPPDLPTGGVVGIAVIVDCGTDSDSVWFTGKWGWLLCSARPLPFYACRGKPGVFDIDYPHPITQREEQG